MEVVLLTAVSNYFGASFKVYGKLFWNSTYRLIVPQFAYKIILNYLQ